MCVRDCADIVGMFPTFRAFLDRIRCEVPLGEGRLLCTEQLLLESDAKLAKVEAEFRPSLLRESQAIIKALSRPISMANHGQEQSLSTVSYLAVY